MQDVDSLTTDQIRRLLLDLEEQRDRLRRENAELRQRVSSQEARLRTETQMQHAQKLESLGVLAGGIAHDFNNQLMGVLGNIEMALDEAAVSSPAREYLKDATQSARAMAKLTHQMLAYSGKGIYVVKPLCLTRLVEDMCQLLATSVRKDVALRYELAVDLPAIDGDADQLRQVVLNFVTNASEAIDGGDGTITISTGRLEASPEELTGTVPGGMPVAPLDSPPETGPVEYVCLEVKDTGTGMDEETRERIFDPFFSTKFTGRGLGLAVTLGIVRGHRGTLTVRSEPGQGTRFQALFPPGEPAEEPAAAPGKKDEPWKGSGLVLVADDEGAVLRVAQRMLEKSGFTTVGAHDGREAVELFHQHRDEIVAVILDLTMPRVGGEEAFAELKAARPELPIFIASGYQEELAAQRFQGSERPAGFIEKPFRRPVLVEKLRAVLAR